MPTAICTGYGERAECDRFCNRANLPGRHRKSGDNMLRRETKQRQLVLNAVRARCDHPSAEQICDDVHSTNTHISRGTVYRNLNLLCEEGEISHVRVPGADRYDLRTDPHDHIFCLKCKKVCDAPYPYKPDPDEEIEKRSGYRIIRHLLVFEGICAQCQSTLIPSFSPPPLSR